MHASQDFLYNDKKIKTLKINKEKGPGLTDYEHKRFFSAEDREPTFFRGTPQKLYKLKTTYFKIKWLFLYILVLILLTLFWNYIKINKLQSYKTVNSSALAKLAFLKKYDKLHDELSLYKLEYGSINYDLLYKEVSVVIILHIKLKTIYISLFQAHEKRSSFEYKRRFYINNKQTTENSLKGKGESVHLFLNEDNYYFLFYNI
jgi:hypothetical protein